MADSLTETRAQILLIISKRRLRRWLNRQEDRPYDWVLPRDLLQATVLKQGRLRGDAPEVIAEAHRMAGRGRHG